MTFLLVLKTAGYDCVKGRDLGVSSLALRLALRLIRECESNEFINVNTDYDFYAITILKRPWMGPWADQPVSVEN